MTRHMGSEMRSDLLGPGLGIGSEMRSDLLGPSLGIGPADAPVTHSNCHNTVFELPTSLTSLHMHQSIREVCSGPS
jgi:hypothetical protein